MSHTYPATTEGTRRSRGPIKSPLYYMGDLGYTPEKNELASRGLSGDSGPDWYLSCDKLRLCWIVSPGQITDSPGVWGAQWSKYRAGRHRGSARSQRRVAKPDTETSTSGQLWFHTTFDSAVQDELRLEFNPNKASPPEWSEIACTLRFMGISPDHAWVERVDVAWDRLVDPYRYRLDPGRFALDFIGMTDRGAETERIGYRKGQKIKAKKYNKGIERRRAGHRSTPDQLRYEVEAWQLTPTCPGVASSPTASSEDEDATSVSEGVRFSDLASVVCPIPKGTGLVELIRDPDTFMDDRYLALGCVALQHGVRASRKCAQRILGKGARGHDRFEFCMWHDHTPRLRSIFERRWPEVVGRLHDRLRPSDALPAVGSLVSGRVG